jgi:hypothetical protein
LDFENREGFFPDVDSRMRFCLVTLRGEKPRTGEAVAQFGWLLHNIAELSLPERLVSLSGQDLLLFNPSSRTCPVFTSVRDFALSKVIYQHGQHIFIDEGHRVGKIDFLGELFNMTRDAGHFSVESTESTLPLYEAKYIHQFDHRFATSANGDVRELSAGEKSDPGHVVTPKSWVEKDLVFSRTSKRGIHLRWMAGFRSIASPTNERTAILAVFPFAGVGNSINMVLGLSAVETAFLMANANAFAFDFCARQKISGSNVNIWIFKQLPAIPFERYAEGCPWSGGTQLLRDWILPRVLELAYTAWDLEPFAQDCDCSCPPFRWDEERRSVLRCELDAAYFHLYLGRESEWDHQPKGLTKAFPAARDAVSYILDTFPIVKRKDEERFNGDYRTKRVIIETYDALAESIRTGQPYRTRLDPPAADSRVSHPAIEQPLVLPSLRATVGQLSQFPAAAWATPNLIAPDNLALFALIDVIRAFDGFAKPSHIRAAAILVRNPAMALAFMDRPQAREWIRVIGAEAQPLPANVVSISQFQKNATDSAWSRAISQLTGSGALQTGTDRWIAAEKFPASSGQDWVAGRSAIAVELVSTVLAADLEPRLTAFLRSVEDGTARRAVS